VKIVIEAINSTIRANHLDAKMLNGKDLSISCSGNATIGAMYSQRTKIEANTAKIGLASGSTKVPSLVPSLLLTFFLTGHHRWRCVGEQYRRLFRGDIGQWRRVASSQQVSGVFKVNSTCPSWKCGWSH
jgi:hypothetical protein